MSRLKTLEEVTMPKQESGKWKSAGAVRADTTHWRTGAHAGSAFGAVMLAASMLTLPSVMLLTSQAVMAQQDSVLEEIIVTAPSGKRTCSKSRSP